MFSAEKNNPEILNKIIVRIQDIQRDCFKGLGETEPLKKNLQ